MQQKGLFITFEGIDGSGKSTQIQLLKNHLETLQYNVFSTFEPTDNPIGKMIRNIIQGVEKADIRTIACLFAADRLHHVLNEEDGLLEKKKKGMIILCDRYYFSSYAYQSLGTDMEWVIELNKKCREIFQPDLNIFIDIEVKEAMKRISTNREHIDLYESENQLKKIKLNYEKAFHFFEKEENWIRIKSEETKEKTFENIWKGVQSIL